MIESRTGGRFRRLLVALPDDVRREAYKAYRLFRRDPAHPSIQFKEVDSKHGIWSARVTQNYRALGQRHGNQITWIWIGTHREYLSRIGKQYYPQQ
ncbi:MAG TPA: hypothetical protein VLJ14_10690 [Ktedonobacterales bacterium]|nr:hypothetical protein [Ktedonobacterales bacterium]